MIADCFKSLNSTSGAEKPACSKGALHVSAISYTEKRINNTGLIFAIEPSYLNFKIYKEHQKVLYARQQAKFIADCIVSFKIIAG